MTYLISLIVGLCVLYFVFLFLYPAFFESRLATVTSRSIYSVVTVVLACVVAFSISLAITDVEWSNRILHAFGGGFVAFMVCFLAARDSNVQVSNFQFLVFSILLVTTLGVANEILEFFLQSYFHLPFSLNPNDTWLDLISNSVGTVVGAALLTPFVGSKNRPNQTGF